MWETFPGKATQTWESATALWIRVSQPWGEVKFFEDSSGDKSLPGVSRDAIQFTSESIA